MSDPSRLRVRADGHEQLRLYSVAADSLGLITGSGQPRERADWLQVEQSARPGRVSPSTPLPYEGESGWTVLTAGTGLDPNARWQR
jgi:hypothetical protein